MRLKKIMTDFFLLMALTTNLSFLFGPNPYELVITVIANLTATILKLGEGKILATEMTAASLVADLHLIPAAFVYFLGNIPEAVSLAVGALAANIISVLLSIIEAIFGYLSEE
ncbi:MAG: DUF6394 family protein [Aquificaceae bacterium]|nr:DUF6394 family protein [Aquificaceae bacterium]MCX8059749.1 DUF6394 family protein [Aquificaceae bacterium]MDW8096664.1 DUF6394 family protein [Aquificaceae bacterium]